VTGAGPRLQLCDGALFPALTLWPSAHTHSRVKVSFWSNNQRSPLPQKEWPPSSGITGVIPGSGIIPGSGLLSS